MTKLEEEYGRSMVEMLGVLAIIGVLSVAGVSGYTTAMNKHRANEILNEASKRALIVASQIALGQEPNLSEFTNNSVGGAVFSTEITKEGADKFVIGYTTPPSAEVQAQIQAIVGNGSTVVGSGSTVVGSGSTVRRFADKGGLVFNNDLTTAPKASDYNGNKAKCPGTYCSGSGLCLESGASCTCSGTAPVCQKCDPATGTFIADTDKNGQQDGCESGKTCDNGSCKTAGCSKDSDCKTLCPDSVSDCYEGGVIDLCGDYGSSKLTRSYCEYNHKCYCYYGSSGCVTSDTLITLADGTCKRADQLTFDDDLLVWNFDEGHFDSAKPLWLKIKESHAKYNVIKFSDGSVLKTCNDHRIFNKEYGEFTYPMLTPEKTPIGTHTLNAKGEWVTVIEKYVVEENVTDCNIVTDKHFNFFAGNVLTSCRLNNLYPIKDMKFVKDNRELVPYSEYAVLGRKWYDGLRLAEQPLDVNRSDAYVLSNDLVGYVQRMMALQRKV